ncbi:MAG: FGGY-family carbohydrate kinase, partial [Eubacterium sp.]
MSQKIIAYDLGTGGIKASLYNIDGRPVASTFMAYDTCFPNENYHEQRPDDWWDAVVETSKSLIEKTAVDVNEIEALAISGHSLGVVPIGKKGELLREFTPIWSDKRAVKQAKDFFENVDYEKWYMDTGSGFPAECYAIFKMMWYKENEPELYAQIDKIIGTKDYCNYRFTGRLCTDYSYASGSGVFDLKKWDYIEEYVKASGINPDILPDIIESDAIVGTISEEAAALTGLPTTVKVIAGGVDNSCMALGARGIKNGRVYTSLGTSAWIALTSDAPVVDFKYKPYVFAHVIKGMYASATSIFSAGNSFKWVRDNLCQELYEKEQQGGEDAYIIMDKMAEASPVGANKIIFNPSLAGGSMIEASPDICGAFAGLRLSTTRNDLIRSAMEGVAVNLRIALDILRTYHTEDMSDMLIVGGGSKSAIWRQIFADTYGLDIIKTNVDQDAASLGAAALAAKGVGLWQNYDVIDELHQVESITKVIPENSEAYNKLLPVFEEVAGYMAKTGESLAK